MGSFYYLMAMLSGIFRMESYPQTKTLHSSMSRKMSKGSEIN
jgi:hypothetical protein